MAEVIEAVETTEITENRRGAFRCPVPKAEETAILRTRKSDIMVRVIEKSASGFGLLTDPKPPLEVGQVLSLALSTGCSEVRVAHLTETGSHCRVGLELLGELQFMKPPGSAFSLAHNGVVSFAGGGLRLALILALCVAFFTFGVTIPASWWREMIGLETSGGSKYSSWSATQREKKLAESFLNLDGLKARKFFDALKLSAEQQVKVHTIVEDTSLALADLYEHKDAGPSDIWSDLGLQLIHRSYEKIQRELTEEQRARWAELSK